MAIRHQPNKNMKISNKFILTSVLIGSISAANAAIFANDIIGLDFGITAATNNYNTLSAVNTGSTSLTELSGGSVITGVSVTTSGFSFSNNDSDHLVGTGPLSSNESNLTDWWGGSGTITFSGLDDSLVYDLTLGHAFNVNATNTDTTFTVDGTTITTYHDNVAGSSYGTLTGLSTDGAGNLTISASPAAGSAVAAISALTLTANTVPEPTSAALLGLGGLALITRRKR